VRVRARIAPGGTLQDVPTKKQQRLREKQRRHGIAYEYVYVDAEGNELDAPPETAKPAKKDAAKPASGRRAVRDAPPPSWGRALKWAGIFTAVMLVISVTGSKGNHAAGALVAILYGVALTPGFYWMHRFQYRTSQRLKQKAAAKR
jgi:hypothetical protein